MADTALTYDDLPLARRTRVAWALYKQGVPAPILAQLSDERCIEIAQGCGRTDAPSVVAAIIAAAP